MKHLPLRWLCGLLLCLLLAPIAGAEQQTLTLAAYNMENLYDVFDNPYTLDEDTRIKPRGEIDAIVATLRHINADVVGVVEVENEGLLRSMVNAFLGDLGYDYIAVTQGNSDRGLNIGVISRKPIVSITSYRFQDLSLPGQSRTWRFARDLLHVKVQAAADRVMDVFIVHFKSRHDSHDDPQSKLWRLAESTRARAVIADILRQDPKAWVAIMGDFNDTPETPSLAGFLQPADGAPALVDSHAHLPAEQRITYLREPYRSTIDYVLVSPDLGKRLVRPRSVVISEARWLRGSDHAPVVAVFNVD